MTDDRSTSDRLVCLGVITGAKGLRGRVRIKPFTADPEGVAAYGPVCDESGEPKFRLTVREVVKGQVVAEVEGVTDRNAAEALKGMRLHVDRDALPEPEEDEFYHRDLIGLAAETVSGEVLGTVMAVHDFGAGTFLDIKGPSGPVMVPFTRAVVPEVDVKGGKVRVDPPPGLLEAPEPEARKAEGEAEDANEEE